jgi:hypothetical protein
MKIYDQDFLNERNRQIDYFGSSDISLEDCEISEDEHSQS